MSELSIIQKTYDLIKWYVPILNNLPRDHKFMLGDRIVSGLYDLLEGHDRRIAVIPMQMGIQSRGDRSQQRYLWIPACAGMTGLMAAGE